MFQRVDFERDGNAFIRLQLSTRSTLWSMFCDLPLEKGRVFAFLPVTVTAWELLHFAWHIHHRKQLEQKTADFDHDLQDLLFVEEFLAKSADSGGLLW